MTEAKEMESPRKSFDVFEFRKVEELEEIAVDKVTFEFERPHALNAENYAEKIPELRIILDNDFDCCERTTETKSDIESGIVFSYGECGSSPGATKHLENPSMDVKPVCFNSDAVNSMTERSTSDISNNASDGPSSDYCFSSEDLDGGRVEIVFYADYLDYQGTQYMDSMVSFSKSYVEARCKTINGDATFHIRLEIEDIVKIESQWSAQFEAGMINIYFISRDAAQVEFDTIHDASGLRELRFPAFESNWYGKCEAIESLNVRYKALWNVLLDTGMEKCSFSPEAEDWILPRSYFPNFDRSFEELIYPKGDPDAVSIFKRDIDLLMPDTFVNDTIIDFYIKYLKIRKNVDGRTKFHFFNSFFFRKLADMDKDPSSAYDGKAAFQRVRKWTRKINLLEKDFIFIPVNYNLHWSLIVLCYFGEVANYEDGDVESARVPCILHMNSLRGTHYGVKDLIQSYLWEEWKERQKGAYEDLLSKFRNLKFIPLELPQQQNAYDCGLFLLHYVELFLEEVPSNFSVFKITSSSKFLAADWFPPAEPFLKRSHIERLISGLLDSESEECPPSGESGSEELNSTHSFEDDIQFKVKSSPLTGCHESPMCQVEQIIEMTLLPTSSARNTLCTKTSELVLKDLFKQVSAPESFTDPSWGALERRASLHDFKIPAPMVEEEVKGSDCFVTTELAKDIFQQPDGVTPEAPGYPYSSVYHQPTSDNVNSTPATSGSLDLVDTSDPTHDPLFINFSGFASGEWFEQPSAKRMKKDDCETQVNEKFAQDLNF